MFVFTKCFAILDVIFDALFKYNQNDIRNCAEYFLDKYLRPIDICCSTHNTSSRKWLCRIVSNIYINNNQKIPIQKLEKMMLRDLRHVKLRREKC